VQEILCSSVVKKSGCSGVAVLCHSAFMYIGYSAVRCMTVVVLYYVM
jgi:hypothetical protein